MDSASLHAKAMGKVLDKGGIAVEFTLETPGAHDPATETYGEPTVAIVTGFAVEIPHDAEEYKSLELIAGVVSTLFFVPNTLGEQPELGSWLEWGLVKRTVSAIIPIQPFGEFIGGKVMVT